MGVKFENREVVGAGPPPGNGPVTRYHCVPRLAYAQVTRNSSPRPWSDFEWAFPGNAARMSTVEAPAPTVRDDLAVRSASVQLFRTYGAGIIAVATFESVLCSPLEFTAVTW